MDLLRIERDGLAVSVDTDLDRAFVHRGDPNVEPAVELDEPELRWLLVCAAPWALSALRPPRPVGGSAAAEAQEPPPPETGEAERDDAQLGLLGDPGPEA